MLQQFLVETLCGSRHLNRQVKAAQMNQLLITLGLNPQDGEWPLKIAASAKQLLDSGFTKSISILGHGRMGQPVIDVLRSVGLEARVSGHYDSGHEAYDSFRRQPGFIFSDAAETVIIVADPAEYRAKLRLLLYETKKTCNVVLPFTGTQNSVPFAPGQHAFENPNPIIFCLFPCAGTKRFIGPMQDICSYYGWNVHNYHPLNINQRYISSIDWNAADAAARAQRDIDENYLEVVRATDFFHFAMIHEPFSVELLRTMPDVRIVMLLRDPRDIVTSYYHLVYGKRTDRSDGIFLAEPSDDLKESRFLELFEGGMFQRTASYFLAWPKLTTIAHNFVAACGMQNAYPVRFEDLHYTPRETYRGVLKWLGYEDDPFIGAMTDERLDAAIHLGSFEAQTGGERRRGEEGATSLFMKNGYVTPCRKGVPGDWRNHFSEKVKARCKELIGEELIALGYEKDKNW